MRNSRYFFVLIMIASFISEAIETDESHVDHTLSTMSLDSLLAASPCGCVWYIPGTRNRRAYAQVSAGDSTCVVYYDSAQHILNARSGTDGTIKQHYSKQDSLVRYYEDEKIILTINCAVIDTCSSESCIASRLKGAIHLVIKASKRELIYQVECLCGC
jgi:hypothetical protein